MLVVTGYALTGIRVVNIDNFLCLEEAMEVVGEAVVVEEVPLVLPGEPSGACGGAGGQSDPDESPSPTPNPRDGQPQHTVINGGTLRLTPCSHVVSFQPC